MQQTQQQQQQKQADKAAEAPTKLNETKIKTITASRSVEALFHKMHVAMLGSVCRVVVLFVIALDLLLAVSNVKLEAVHCVAFGVACALLEGLVVSHFILFC